MSCSPCWYIYTNCNNSISRPESSCSGQCSRLQSPSRSPSCRRSSFCVPCTSCVPFAPCTPCVPCVPCRPCTPVQNQKRREKISDFLGSGIGVASDDKDNSRGRSKNKQNKGGKGNGKTGKKTGKGEGKGSSKTAGKGKDGTGTGGPGKDGTGKDGTGKDGTGKDSTGKGNKDGTSIGLVGITDIKKDKNKDGKDGQKDKTDQDGKKNDQKQKKPEEDNTAEKIIQGGDYGGDKTNQNKEGICTPRFICKCKSRSPCPCSNISCPFNLRRQTSPALYSFNCNIQQNVGSFGAQRCTTCGAVKKQIIPQQPDVKRPRCCCKRCCCKKHLQYLPDQIEKQQLEHCKKCGKRKRPKKTQVENKIMCDSPPYCIKNKKFTSNSYPPTKFPKGKCTIESPSRECPSRCSHVITLVTKNNQMLSYHISDFDM